MSTVSEDARSSQALVPIRRLVFEAAREAKRILYAW